MIIVISNIFIGRTKDWFMIYSISMEKMKMMEGWIEYLKEEFKVNIIMIRIKVNRRKYTINDDDIMKYFYIKLELLWTTNEKIDESILIDEIWLDLSTEFHILLNYNDISNLRLIEFDHLLRDKDLNFREAWKRKNRDEYKDSSIQDKFKDKIIEKEKSMKIRDSKSENDKRKSNFGG
jgi:hypothetical protein